MEGRNADPSCRLVVGLGNPGPEYRNTRHNLGFRLLEELASRRQVALANLECKAIVGGDAKLLLAMPQTYMNRSGYAVRCLAERYEFETEQILIAYDDVSLPLGRLRLRAEGGPGGHRGMESVVENLRTQKVARLRMGVGLEDGASQGEDLADFVLSPFSKGETGVVEEMVERAIEACEIWCQESLGAAMNRCNREA